MKNYVKLSILFISVLLNTVIWANNQEKVVDEKLQKYCTFNGILKNESRWGEEFKMLDEPEDYPNFQYMSDMLSVFIVLPDSMIKTCPTLKKYLTALVENKRNSNSKLRVEIKKVIELLAKKLQNIHS